MISATTGDIETIRLLSEAVKKHRGQPESWKRFGAQLEALRTQLGYPYGRREQFLRDRSRPGGLTSKDAYEMEGGRLTGGRKAWPAGKLIAAAEVYGFTLRSVPGALDGGDLEPVPVAVPALRGAPQALPAATAPPAVWDGLRMSGVPHAEAVIAAAAPQATAILLRLITLAAEGNVHPAGKDVFEGDDPASRDTARRWNRLAEDMPESDFRAWYIAIKAVTEADASRLAANAG